LELADSYPFKTLPGDATSPNEVPNSTMKFSVNTVLFVSPFADAHTDLFRQLKKWGLMRLNY
jgi:hypothetical protein